MTNVLEVRGLTIAYRQGRSLLDAVRDVSLEIAAGQTYGLVGESGSGKSTLAHAALRYLSEDGEVRQGAIYVNGRDLYSLDDAAMRGVWASEVKLVPQDALSSLNPSLRIGEQLAEGLPAQNGDAAQVHDLLRMVRIADPERVAQSYPHELSGGMQQRVMVALALSAEPDLLVLDEPTTSLDVTTEAAILDLVAELIRARKTSVLFVSHNLGVVARICDRVAVLYAGELVEDAPVADLYRKPLHPYTHGLLAGVPRVGQNKATNRLQPIPGSIPRLDEIPAACIFAPRCPVALERCHVERPALEEPAPGRRVRCHRWREILSGELDLSAAYAQAQQEPAVSHIDRSGGMIPPDGSSGVPKGFPIPPLRQPSRKVTLRLDGLTKRFPLPRSLAAMLRREPPRAVQAVNGIDLEIHSGRTLGLVGESGSGKTTLARCVIGLVEATGGEMRLLDIPLARSLGERDRETLHRLQMVFQNPDDALNPYLTVAETLRRPLLRLKTCPPNEVDAYALRLLELVNLRREYAGRLPGQLSGGEKQRVAIARAFAANPDLILFDESVSSLDVSVQAAILNLLAELQQARGSAYLFITHDLGVVSYLADEIAVIYLGRLMEVGQVEDFFRPPHHPYTEALLSAVAVAEPGAQRTAIRLEGETPSLTSLPSGCPFHTRCPRFLGDICAQQTPPWQDDGKGHRIFCHIPLGELKELQHGAGA